MKSAHDWGSNLTTTTNTTDFPPAKSIKKPHTISIVSELIFLSFYCGRFFLGSNKVMQVSLGRSVADEIRPGLHKVSKVGLHSMLVGEIYCCSNIDLNWIF